MISFEILSASMIFQLFLVNSLLTVDLPHAIPPVRPIIRSYAPMTQQHTKAKA
jgi:hypothetical protein